MITVKKYSVLYEISYEPQGGSVGREKVTLLAELHPDGKISLHPNSGEKFRFNRSDPKLVAKIADIFKRATDLAAAEDWRDS